MQAFRLCRANYPAYDGEGARRVGGRWNSKGTAAIPDDVVVEILDESGLPANWATLDPREQEPTKRIGDEWVARQRSVILSVPSVILGERNYVLNPAHPDFQRIALAEPVPFRLDVRLFSVRSLRVV